MLNINSHCIRIVDMKFKDIRPYFFFFVKNSGLALASVARLAGCHPTNLRGVGAIPHQGTCQSWEFGPRSRHIGKTTDGCFFLAPSCPFYLKSISMFSGEDKYIYTYIHTHLKLYSKKILVLSACLLWSIILSKMERIKIKKNNWVSVIKVVLRKLSKSDQEPTTIDQITGHYNCVQECQITIRYLERNDRILSFTQWFEWNIHFPNIS